MPENPLFTAAPPPRTDLAAAPVPPTFTAHITPGNGVFAAPANLTLLQAAELSPETARSLDSSCRNGTCRTCICQLVSGQISYRIEWPGLSLEEKREGYILPCVAYPASDVVLQLPF